MKRHRRDYSHLIEFIILMTFAIIAGLLLNWLFFDVLLHAVCLFY